MEAKTITKDKYVNLVFATMQNFKSNYVSTAVFPGILQLLYDSDEFKNVAQRLDLQDMDLDTILKNKHVTSSMDENKYVRFKMSKQEQDKIMDEDPEATVAVNNAAIKYGYVLQAAQETNGKVTFASDDPDGPYELPYSCEAGDETEAKLYTDGKIKDNHTELAPDYDIPYRYNRTLDIEDSTYVIIVDERRGKVTGVTIRALTVANYQLMLYEGYKLAKGLSSGYKTEIDEKPRVYTLNRN